MKFVVFHGSFGSPDENWFPQLKEQLQLLKQEVIVPKFPIEDWDDLTKKGPNSKINNQSLGSWLKVFEKELLEKIEPGEKLCFIGHSLGPLFILHLLDKYNLNLDCAIFVSPFMEELNSKEFWPFDLVNSTFYKSDFDFKKLKKRISTSYVIYSDSDPYVPNTQSKNFASKLDSSLIMVKKAGHMNYSTANLNEFPLVYELCKSRLNLSLYQRYLEHRQQIFAINYLKGRHEEVVYLKPEEIFDEGLFHFRNLAHKGFCTFFTGLDIWDTQGQYYEEARKAAKRIRDFTRVFIVKDIKDLNKKNLLDQIRRDQESLIKTYLLMERDISDKVGELDFGLWDKDYVCIVRFNKSKQVEVKLSSRKTDLENAEKWEKIILKYATRIQNSNSEIKNFIIKHSD